MNEKSALDLLWIVLCSGLVFLMQAGFLCLESGLTRSKNNINVALKNLTDFGIATVLFWLFGYALMFGQSQGGWIGTSGFVPPIGQGGAGLAVFFLFQVMFCGTAVTILSGAIAERMRFSGYLVAAAIVAGIIYPLYGHWTWNGSDGGTSAGWLGRLGFVDFAGSTAVHSVGGWVALAALLEVGPRTGRFAADGTVRTMPASNLPVAMLGVFLLWFGWLGFNGGCTLGFNGRTAGIIANTVLAGGAGMVLGLGLDWGKHGRAGVDAVINGTLGGLVSITASCHAVTAPVALLIGGVGGLIAFVLDDLLKRWRIDDAVGAVPVHLGAGVWGTLAVAFFGNAEQLGTGLGRGAQLAAQALGILVCAAWSFSTAWAVFRLLNHWLGLRVSVEEERVGLNVAEHGASSDLHELFDSMELQARSGDWSIRAPVEAFTEVGQIAERYNAVVEKVESAIGEVSVIKRALEHTALVSVTDHSGKIIDANEEFCRVSEYTRAELLGQDHRILNSGHHPREFWAQAWRTIAAGELWRNEVCNRSKSGRLYWVDSTIVPQASASGRIERYVSIRIEITARKEAEQRARLVIDTALDAIIGMNSRGLVTAWNAQAQALFGYAASEAVGSPLHELIVPDEFREAHVTGLARYLRTGEGPVLGKRVEIDACHKDGRRIPIELTITPVIDTNGVWFSAFLRDLSEKKAGEVERAHLEARVAEHHKLEAVGQLAAGMAHEINTPVQFVSDNTRFVQESFGGLSRLFECSRSLTDADGGAGLVNLRAVADEIDIDFLLAEIPRALNESLGGLERVSSIVQAMKEFSHPGSSVASRIDLNHALQTTATVARNEWKYVAELEFDLDPSLPPVSCFPGELNQAVLNMIVNSAHAIGDRAAETPGTLGKIRIGTKQVGDRARITIQDTGGGIPDAIRHRIFEPFFTTKEVGKGTGQGLAIARSVVVDKHHGTIDVRSEAGVGTTFVIELPIDGTEALDGAAAAA